MRACIAFACLALVGCGHPIVLSPYGSRFGVGREHGGGAIELRREPHDGADIRGYLGDPVIASADGSVVLVEFFEVSGHEVWVRHPNTGRITVYLHLGTVAVARGDRVRRGETLGTIGVFPYSEDPVSITVGCFRADTIYPDDHLALTYPVRC